ncbi:GNAT family N-acetyltransferase [Streptomyces sp. NPDC006553]|uniref:GNAT family N-acetyltransferase n=1 Tax=unclassified Streptomyces TaxID=2593676 RepID=UPI002258E59A|nr:GNAT family N-acetyltransferase [Streptomyces sp. NBC_00233]MCX5230577.1 GNAT family N-acetyltransferase [Streptomyces sp. NBC_00233]
MSSPQPSLRETPGNGAAPSTPPLLLRPWTYDDAEPLVRHHRDPHLRAWLATRLDTIQQARAWVDAQNAGWVAGTRAAFAIVEDAAAGGTAPLGHIAVTGEGAAAVRVGYWTAPQARGRGIASRALTRVARWVAYEESPFAGRTPELVHAVGNEGSCRTALTCGFSLTATLPAAPPARPRAQHLHTAAVPRTPPGAQRAARAA